MGGRREKENSMGSKLHKHAAAGGKLLDDYFPEKGSNEKERGISLT